MNRPLNRIGRYEILGVLGQGGFATVYKARDSHVYRLVALKVLRVHSGDDMEARLRREARMAARLLHPNIVAIHDFGVTEDLAFLAMEYIDGVTLDVLLERTEREPSRGKDLLPALMPSASALDYAHRAGIVH